MMKIVMPTALYTHAECLRHDMGAHHPRAARALSAIEDQLIASGLAPLLRPATRRRSPPTSSSRACIRVRIRATRSARPRRAGGTIHLDPDTAMNPYTLQAALRAAGAAVLATDLVIGGEGRQRLLRGASAGPPRLPRAGDGLLHLQQRRGRRARHALEAHGLERVAIIDFDVHHGNGTEDIFADDERVLMASTFQHPFYPYSGTDDPAPNMVNVPLAAGSGRASSATR